MNGHSVGSSLCDEQGFLCIGSIMQIPLQPNSTLCSEVKLPLFIPLCDNDDRSPLPVDVMTIDPLNFNVGFLKSNSSSTSQLNRLLLSRILCPKLDTDAFRCSWCLSGTAITGNRLLNLLVSNVTDENPKFHLIGLNSVTRDPFY